MKTHIVNFNKSKELKKIGIIKFAASSLVRGCNYLFLLVKDLERIHSCIGSIAIHHSNRLTYRRHKPVNKYLESPYNS